MAIAAASKQPAILVVEDEPTIRMTLSDALREAGLDVFEAGDADQAISILSARSEIRVVVTDVEMPGSMDGTRLARLVRDRWPPVQIIVTSGKPRPQADDLPLHTKFFAKPYALPRIVEAVKNLTP